MNRSALARVTAGVCLALLPGGGRQASRLDRCLAAPPSAAYQLSQLYQEISGLAMTADGRLLFHNDDVGAVGVMDLAAGKLAGNFSLGPTLPRDDFEGIAVPGQRLFLISSVGRLYETRVPGRTETQGSLALARGRPGRGFRASGLEWDPKVSHFLLVAAADRAVLEIDGAGKVVSTRALAGRHSQAEGIALGPNGELVLSDEGGTGPGTITVYACR